MQIDAPSTAGYGEAGEEGRRAQDELVAVADELGMLVVGPNGQGVVSTPARLCAQIVAPYPPAGRIGIVSQSGNFVSSFMNYALHSGVQRVIGYLLRDVDAGNGDAPVTVSLPVSKATIASRLSLTPEYFSRVLHELEAAGLVRIDKRDIHILDAQALATYRSP